MTRYEVPIDEKRRFVMPRPIRLMLQAKDPNKWRIMHMLLDEGSLILYDDRVWQDRGDLFYRDADTLEKQESIDAFLRTEKEVEIGHQYKILIPKHFFEALDLREGGNIIVYGETELGTELANPKDSPACHVKTPEESERVWFAMFK